MTRAPLEGLRVIELPAIGPIPYAGQLLADMGAEVIVVDKPARGPVGSASAVERRGKKSVIIDLREPAGASLLLEMAQSAHALIEGFRPGVAERLGIGPKEARERNPALVYGRMTGWGQEGPYSGMAGHDINYIAITGALHAMGENGRPPSPPLNLVGDYGGGSLFLVAGVLAALYAARETGTGAVVDAAISDAVVSMMGLFHSMEAEGQWSEAREDNLLDGAAPFYRCYECADGRYVAVGCLEPKFFAAMMEGLEIDPHVFGAQYDKPRWARQRKMLEEVFARRSRDEWAERFMGTDACVTPVLTYREAHEHPHLHARVTLRREDDMTHPGPAPRIEGAPPHSMSIPEDGEHTREVLRELGISQERIRELEECGAIGAAEGDGER